MNSHLTPAESEALARITGGHVKPFNHHPCITCAVQAEVARIVAERIAPVQAILDAWEAWDGSPGPGGRVHPDSSSPSDRERLRSALEGHQHNRTDPNCTERTEHMAVSPGAACPICTVGNDPQCPSCGSEE